MAGTKRAFAESNAPASKRTKSRGSTCNSPSCTKLAKMGGFCIAHGGGRRCKHSSGCKSSDQGGGFCKKHGGGKRCQFDGCTKSDVGFGRCTAHGGGHRCQFVDEQGKVCGKSDQGGAKKRLCKSHGGGRKCQHPSGCRRADAGGKLCRVHAKSGNHNSTTTTEATSQAPRKSPAMADNAANNLLLSILSREAPRRLSLPPCSPLLSAANFNCLAYPPSLLPRTFPTPVGFPKLGGRQQQTIPTMSDHLNNSSASANLLKLFAQQLATPMANAPRMHTFKPEGVNVQRPNAHMLRQRAQEMELLKLRLSPSSFIGQYRQPQPNALKLGVTSFTALDSARY
jgi:hypothetical protein